MPLLKFLGSLYFAVFLIASLAILLTVSTVFESLHGTPLAQEIFYRAGWFDVFLALLWTNIFSSAALRFPFKKRHTGFVATHIGILVLLFGALVSRQFGAEGRMPLAEGERSSKIIQDGRRLSVMFPEHKTISFPLNTSSKPYQKHARHGEFSVVVHRVIEAAARRIEIAEGGPNAPANRAVELRLQSKRVGLDGVFRLIEKDPENPHARLLALGPATLELSTPETEAQPKEPTLKITLGEKRFEMAVSQNTAAEFDATELGLQIKNFRFYAHAKVDDQVVVDSPEDTPFNPAVSFEISDASGKSEKHTKFAIFPSFSSLHGGPKAEKLHLGVALVVPFDAFAGGASSSAKLKIVRDPDGWRYQSVTASGQAREGAITRAKAEETGWMDMRFTPVNLYDCAVITRRVAAAEPGETSSAAAEISLKIRGIETEKQWVFENEPVSFDTLHGDFQVAVSPQERSVPFMIELKDFRKIDYPGTGKPAFFESDVVLFDSQKKIQITRTISMNKPLDYAGWRIFQSSYFQESFGEGSVFTIAKNPGILLIYGGAIVLFAGVFILFYVPPFSSFTKEKRTDADAQT